MLPKEERITQGSEIKGVLNRKQFHFSSPLLSFAAEENNKMTSRLAVVCSKRLGSAVVRNRTKRTVVWAFKELKHHLLKKVNVVVVPRKAGLVKESYFGSMADGLRSNFLWQE